MKLSVVIAAFDEAPPWLAATLLLLFAGALVRVGVTFPSHQYPPDADCALNALCAFKFLSGHTPVFFSGVRIGSLGSLLTALLFALLGVSRTALALGSLLVGLLTMLAWYGLCREVLGARGALFALPFVVLPNPAFTFWTYMPNGYPETLLFCAAILWLALRVDRGGGRGSFAFGVAVGLGVWQSLQTLGCSAPALVWLLFRRPGLLRNRSVLLRAAAGFVLGALPWIVYNVHHPLGSFHGNFAARPAPGAAAVLDNARFLLFTNLPEALASAEPLGHGPGGVASPDPYRQVVLLLTAGALLLFFVAPSWLRRRARTSGRDASGADWTATGARLLFGLVLVAFAALNVFSEAGMGREVTVRYVLPVYLLVPVALAVPLGALAARSRPAAVIVTLLILAFDLRQTYLPWTARHRAWVAAAATDEELLALLRRHRVTAVVGDYWQVYPVNFLSKREIRGVPTLAAHDFWHVADELPPAPLRWALLDRSAATLAAWARRAELPGTAVQLAQGRAAFLPAGGPDAGTLPEAFLGRLRAAAADGRRAR